MVFVSLTSLAEKTYSGRQVVVDETREEEGRRKEGGREEGRRERQGCSKALCGVLRTRAACLVCVHRE